MLKDVPPAVVSWGVAFWAMLSVDGLPWSSVRAHPQEPVQVRCLACGRRDIVRVQSAPKRLPGTHLWVGLFWLATRVRS